MSVKFQHYLRHAGGVRADLQFYVAALQTAGRQDAGMVECGGEIPLNNRVQFVQ